MLDQLFSGGECQPGLFHVAPQHAATLRAQGIDDDVCTHGWNTTSPVGLRLLLEPPVEHVNSDHPHPEPTVEMLSMGDYKANTHVETAVITKNGQLFGAGLDPSIRRAVTRARLDQEPPEPPPYQFTASSDPYPSANSSLLLAEEGPVVGARPKEPTVVSGAAKAGKSTVVAMMLAARRDTPAIWLAGEAKETTHRTLGTAGAHRVLVGPLPTTRRQIEQASKLALDHQPEIAVLDPYGIAAATWGYDANHEETAAKVLHRLHEIVGEIPVIIITHDRKSGEHSRSGPALDRPRGSSALVGYAGIVHHVTKTGDGRHQVRTIGYRYGENPAPWTYDRAMGCWLAATPAEKKTDQILAVLEDADEPMSCRQLGAEIGGGRSLRPTVKDLEQLAAEGLVHKVTGGRGSGHRWAFGPATPATLL